MNKSEDVGRHGLIAAFIAKPSQRRAQPLDLIDSFQPIAIGHIAAAQQYRA